MFMRMPVKLCQPLRALALTLLLTPAAHAQLSGSAGLLSNYMYRGLTFSDDKPVARLALNYDAPNGLYAGGQVVNGQLSIETHRSAQFIGYAGYAQRLASGMSWEAGVTAYGFPSNGSWNFREYYVGLAGETVSARLHYAPDYLGFGERTLYAEVNGGAQITDRIHYFWHGGYLHFLSDTRRSRAEARFGVGTALQGWQANLSLDLTRLRDDSGDVYQRERNRIRHEFVFAVARTF